MPGEEPAIRSEALQQHGYRAMPPGMESFMLPSGHDQLFRYSVVVQNPLQFGKVVALALVVGDPEVIRSSVNGPGFIGVFNY